MAGLMRRFLSGGAKGAAHFSPRTDQLHSMEYYIASIDVMRPLASRLEAIGEDGEIYKEYRWRMLLVCQPIPDVLILVPITTQAASSSYWARLQSSSIWWRRCGPYLSLLHEVSLCHFALSRLSFHPHPLARPVFFSSVSLFLSHFLYPSPSNESLSRSQCICTIFLFSSV